MPGRAGARRRRGQRRGRRKIARKLRLRGTTKTGGGKGRAKQAGTATARLEVTGRAKRRFRKLRKATVTLRVTVEPAGGTVQKGTRKPRLKR